jgi:thiaminase/transcriptional activator TenA
MTFSTDAWARNAALYETIRTMPFNRELADGSLDRASFLHYIVQDAHYLVAFGRCLAIAAAKAPTPDDLVQLAGSAQGAVVVERALHEGFFRTFGISAAQFQATPVAPSCAAYTNFLLATAHQEPFAVNVAALLPCFWIYAEIGRDIHARAAADNPYRAWIDTYAGEDFQSAVARMIHLVDAAAASQSPSTIDAMHAAFTLSTRYEYMFWDGAYRREAWPV